MYIKTAICLDNDSKFTTADAEWTEQDVSPFGILDLLLESSRNLVVSALDKDDMMHAIWLDLDETNIRNPNKLVQELPVFAIWYYTHGHLTKEKPGYSFRIAIPLAAPVHLKYLHQLVDHAKSLHPILESCKIDAPRHTYNANFSKIKPQYLSIKANKLPNKVCGKNASTILWDTSELNLHEPQQGTPGLLEITLEVVHQALMTQEALMLSQDYSTWISVGQCLFHQYGADNIAAYELWVAWSKTGSYSTTPEKVYKAKWKSFATNSDKTRKLGTLRHILKEAGLNTLESAIDESVEIVWDSPAPENNPVIEEYNQKKITKGIPSGIIDLLDESDPAKQLYDWLMRASITSSPTACLACTLSFLGFVRSHGFALQSKEYTPSNLYIILIGGTGGGKSSTVRLLQELASKMAYQVYGSILTGVTGGPALQDRLLQQPRTLLYIDEIGRKSGGSNTPFMVKKEDQEVETMMIELLGAEARPYPCRKFAIDRKAKTVPEDEFIQFPHLSMIATTTLARFQNQNLHMKAEDGYLNRHLVMLMEDPATDDESIMRQIEGSWISKDKVAPPQSLIVKLEEMYKQGMHITHNVDEYGNPMSRKPFNSSAYLKPIEIPVPLEIQKYLNAQHLRTEKVKHSIKDEAIQMLYSRYPMMVRRIMTAIAPIFGPVEMRHAEFAHELVYHTIVTMSKIMETQAVTSNTSHVWDRIVTTLTAFPNGTSSVRDLYRRIKMKKQDLEPILQAMVTARIITKIVQPTEGGGPPKESYQIIPNQE